jgi:hypothetical protein
MSVNITLEKGSEKGSLIYDILIDQPLDNILCRNVVGCCFATVAIAPASLRVQPLETLR